jgi:uncharacterized alkaline shock family protein YloU
MKNFLKTMLVFLGVFAVVTAGCMLLTISGNADILRFGDILEYIEANRPAQVAAIVVLAIYGLFGILSVALSGNLNNDVKSGVVLELKIGDVHISTQTFESIVANVAKKYNGIKTAKVNIKLKETGVGVDLYVYVLQDTVITDITSKIQTDIKETILKQTTVAVENVNVRVKGVYTPNENKEV